MNLLPSVHLGFAAWLVLPLLLLKVATASAQPEITQQPTNQMVLLGAPATFSVGASGEAPLAYQWRRDSEDITGAISNSYTLPAAIAADHGVAFLCVVTNSSGAVTSNPALLQIASNHPPIGSITTPTNGFRFAAGTTVKFEGTASDPEDGELAEGRFSWTVDYHHDTNINPVLAPFIGVTNGSFFIPNQGETATNIWYRITLTVSDSAEQTHTTFQDIYPLTANITLATSPAGLQLTWDGQTQTTPFAQASVVGRERTLGVISPQTLGDTSYEFVAWSDNGATTHVITTPAPATTYTATFQAVGTGMLRYKFTYADRTAFGADGWDFLARTATGETRDTEQTNGAVVDYSQSIHPDVLRVPADVGDLWTNFNSTRNSLFRDLPSNWSSLRLKLAFHPTQNYQQAGLLVYRDDDHYVQVTRIYNNGNQVSFAAETNGAGVVLQAVPETATNLLLRLDRNAVTDRISGYYSLNGTNWIATGSGTIQIIDHPRLALIVGGSPEGLPPADFSWVEVITLGDVTNAPSISIVAPGVTNARFHFTFATQSGVNYTVEFKNQLGEAAWQTLTNTTGTGDIVIMEDPEVLGASRFYRIRVP